MTTAWYLTVATAQRSLSSSDCGERAHEFAPLPPSLRLVARDWGGMRLFEAFVDGGALSAVHTARPGRRADYVRCLRQLALAMLESGGEVGFMRAENEAPTSTVLGSTTLEAAVARAEVGWWRLDLGFVIFRFGGVEGRLWSPLNVNEAQAVGFFADYEVAATCNADARGALRDALAHDEAWTDVVPPPQVVGLSDEAFFRRVSGRAFFA